MKGVLKLNYDSIETCIIHPELVETANQQASKRNLKFRPIFPLLWSNVQGLLKCGEGFRYAVMEEEKKKKKKIEKKKRKKKAHILRGLFHRLLNLFPVMFWKGHSDIHLDIFKNKMDTTGLKWFYSVFICCFDVVFMHFSCWTGLAYICIHRNHSRGQKRNHTLKLRLLISTLKFYLGMYCIMIQKWLLANIRDCLSFYYWPVLNV